MLARGALAQCLGALRLQQQQLRHAHCLAPATTVASGAQGCPPLAPQWASPSAAAAGAWLSQSRSKWWWSRSNQAPGGGGSDAVVPVMVLGSGDGGDTPSAPTPSALPSASDAAAGAADAGASAADGAAGASAADGAAGAAASATNVMEAASAVVDATSAAEAAAFAAARADVWFGTRSFIDLLDWSHATLGMPWWAAICVSNLVVRVATFPVTVLMQQKGGRMTELRAHTMQMQGLYQRASKVATLAEYERLQAQLSAAQAEFKSKFGADAKWALVMPLFALLNGAVFVSQFSAVSTTANEQPPSMARGGLAWFSDLTVPDPLYGLPLLCAAMTLAMVESGALQAEMGQAQSAAALKWVMRAVALAFVPLGSYVPSAVGLLWASNSVLSLVQAAALRSPRARAALGLPSLPASAAAAAAGRGSGGAGAGTAQGQLVARLQELVRGDGRGGGSGGGDGAAAACRDDGAGAAAPGGGAGRGAVASPPPPGMRPSRLVMQKPAGWKQRR